jgi:hypothetical protein
MTGLCPTILRRQGTARFGWVQVQAKSGTTARAAHAARATSDAAERREPLHYQRLPPAREPLPARYPPPDRKPPPPPRGADGFEISTLSVRPPSA